MTQPSSGCSGSSGTGEDGDGEGGDGEGGDGEGGGAGVMARMAPVVSAMVSSRTVVPSRGQKRVSGGSSVPHLGQVSTAPILTRSALALERLGLVVGAQRVDHRIQLTVEDRVEVVARVADAVIGEPVLR